MPPFRPPVADRRPATDIRHGHLRVDPFAWLRDDNWPQVMKDPSVLTAEIRAYLEAENAFTDATLAPTQALQKRLFAEMKGRIKEADSSVPLPDGSYSYYVRYRTGGQHPLFCRQGPEGTERVMIDGDKEAVGPAFLRFAGCDHSPDHRLIAYAADAMGAEFYTVRFRDAESGSDLDDVITDTQGEFAWANDGRTLFYVRLDANHRAIAVYRHRVGTPAASDDLIYEQPDSGFYLNIRLTESKRFIVINVHDHDTSAQWLIDADRPESAPRPVTPLDVGVRCTVSHRGGDLLILTNANGAEDFKLVAAPVEAPGRENWRDLIPHRPGNYLRSILVFADHLVRLERVEGQPRIVVRRFADGQEHTVEFAEEAYDLGIVTGYEFATSVLRFTYSSPTTPQRTYDYDMESRKRTLRKEQEVPSGHNPNDYVTRRLFADSHDGARVPITVLHRADTPIDGSAPLLLYGYGSYGLSIPAAFVTNRLSLVDRGFVYAIAHIRGGTEMGWNWYRDGKLLKKNNTFLDFIAAAERLIAAGYAQAGNIACHGGSAGGLLIGAVINKRPDLFKAAIAEVPFVDVLNTICDPSLPLTPPEWPEWGNPIENPADYANILSYSPYDNIRAQDYPHIIALGGLTDPRVTYWEPAKWVAKLRATKTDDNLLLMRINMDAGHAGAAGRFDRLEEVALVYAFVLMVFGRADAVDCGSTPVSTQ